MSETRESEKGKLIAHSVWGIIGFSSCLLLALAGGGHPAPIIFVPVVAGVWAVGHGVIWIVGRIAASGRRSAPGDGSGVLSWPPGLKLALALTGAASAIGLIQVLGSVLMTEWYPFRLPALWATTMAIWIAHGACFVGMLLRKSWSRPLCAALPLAWAALLIVQMADHLLKDSRTDVPGLAIAVVLVLLLILFGYYLAASKRVRAQFEI